MLSARELHISRGRRELIGGVNLDIGSGRITGGMGPTGAGKSSLLLALAGMIPARGRIVLLERPLSGYSREEIAGALAWQGELPPVEFGLSVVQRLQLAATDAEPQTIEAAAAGMEVDGLLDRPLGALSSGERQRVELAALMLRDVPLWLLDEPTAHLDLRHQLVCLGRLRDEAASGRAIMVVLHDIQQAMAIADDVVLFGADGAVSTGSAADMLSRQQLQDVFGVALQEGTLLPDYRGGS